MAHKNQAEIFSAVKYFYPDFFWKKRVLEVGSQDLNGSVRGMFEECEFIGCDVAPGKGIDIVVPGQLLEFPSNHFDVVISTECFEHNPYWIETFSNMLRMLRSDGIILITCASAGRGEHGTPRTSPQYSPLTSNLGWNYYKNLSKKDFYIFDLRLWLSSYVMLEGSSNNDLIIVGLGKGHADELMVELRARLVSLMKYSLHSMFLSNLNKILGDLIFQELYLLCRRWAPFFLRSNSR